MFPNEPQMNHDAAARRRTGRISSLIGIFCNVALFAGKLTVGLLSGAVSITADAMNNLSDASGAIVTYLGFRLGDKPADSHHPYGHARLEYLSALAVSVLILFIGAELGKSAVLKILDPGDVAFGTLTAAVLLASIAVKLGLWQYYHRLGLRIGSPALEAAARDSRNDCVATTAVLLSGIVQKLWGFRLDGWMGLAVAVFILISGWRMARQTISPLLGESADPQLRQKLTALMDSYPQILGYHDLMVHDYGPGSRFASIHVEMDHSQDVLQCHALIDQLEREYLQRLGVHMVIHYDPVITDDPELNRMRQLVGSVLRMRHEAMSIHDFRMSKEAGVTVLTFDVTLPQHLRGSENAIRTALEQTLLELGCGKIRAEMTFDLEEFG